MRISDWSSDVCSSDLVNFIGKLPLANCWIARGNAARRRRQSGLGRIERRRARGRSQRNHLGWLESRASQKVSRGEKAGKWCGSTRAMMVAPMLVDICGLLRSIILRSEEHTSELQSLMRISYAVFC